MNGFLLIDKPTGWTSFDVVNYVRGVIRQRIRIDHEQRGYCVDTQPSNRSARCTCKKVKVGHTGTLDPAATGLLVLCIGTYTKKVTELIRHDKAYEAEITFGATSDTGDGEGEITKYELRGEEYEVSEEELTTVLKGFVGEIEQVPPKYSALKVDGKRAYDLARAGKEFELQARTITIHAIDLIEYTWPVVRIMCTVGSGTYIRTLAEDIGVELGVGAYLSGLRRTSVDTWSVDEATDPKEHNH